VRISVGWKCSGPCPLEAIEVLSLRVLIKAVPVIPLTEYHDMKAYWGVEAQLHPFLDLGTRRR
jgi:hypothetical protein